MKKFLTIAALAFLTFSCSDDDESNGPNLSDNPEAIAAHDDSAMGIYKGVFVGSSGTVHLNLNNDEDNVLEATMVIDGTEYNFTTTETITDGQMVEDLTFTNGNMSFDFYAGADGSGAELYNINFPSHPNATVIILKEYSDDQVEVFTGTYSGDDSGVFNLIFQGGFIYGLSRSNDPNADANFLEATMNAQSDITGSFDGGAFTGERNGNGISGDWMNLASESGTWTGSRKL